MCVLLGFLQKTWVIPIMNPLLWFMTCMYAILGEFGVIRFELLDDNIVL